MEHHFSGPSYTIGIEEELMIVDAELLRARQRDRVPARGRTRGRHDGRGDQARADGVGAGDRDASGRQHGGGGRAAAGAASPGLRDRRAARPGDRLGGHASVRPLGGPADRVAPALPRAGQRAPIRCAPGADLRPARPRRPRRSRQGDPRRQRHARPSAGPARAQRQLAVLARRRHGHGEHARCRSSARSRAWASRRATATGPTTSARSSSWSPAA